MEQNQPNGNQALPVLNQSELCGQQFTVYGTAEQPLFKAADVAELIEHTDVSTMVRSVDEDERLIQTLFVAGQRRDCLMLTEDGLYEVLMQSRKPIAKDFKKGVKQILKEIRKNGGYMAAKEGESEAELMARAFVVAKATIERQQAQLEAANDTIRLQGAQIEAGKQEIVKLAPKAEYCDQVLQSDSTHAISDVAKELGMSGPKLYEKLRIHRILFKRGGKWFPYDKFVPKGYFATRTIPFMHRDGSQGSNSYTVLTEIGRQWLHTLNQRNAIA